MSVKVILFSLCLVALASATYYYPRPKPPVSYVPKPPVYKPTPKPGCKKVIRIIFVFTQCMYVGLLLFLLLLIFVMSQDTYAGVSGGAYVLFSDVSAINVAFGEYLLSGCISTANLRLETREAAALG